MKHIFTSIAMAGIATVGINASNPEMFTIEGSVGKLHAELQKPATDKKEIPLVVLCHGFTGNGNTELLKDIANDLQSQGIASLRFDLYTYAERYVQGYKDATLKIIPDEDHSFTKDTAEAALYASDWLTKQIKGVIQSRS